MSTVGPPPHYEELTRAISAAMVALYAEVYDHRRTTASTFINGDVVVCILEDILCSSEQELVAAGGSSEVIEGRIAFQADREDEFCAAVERVTRRRVVAFLSGNQASPGIACELFFLQPLDGAL
ncbi:MAG TPA: Na-translocating system protein MpsC family protein [Solirubrobacteraceae bacterium]|nr:Na-translocating system protein MpsC family protein [Solirubrobacteraceae bacterium]